MTFEFEIKLPLRDDQGNEEATLWVKEQGAAVFWLGPDNEVTSEASLSHYQAYQMLLKALKIAKMEESSRLELQIRECLKALVKFAGIPPMTDNGPSAA